MYIDKYTQTIFEWKFTPMATYICPTYKVTKNESNAPRGLTFLLSLIEGKQQREFDDVIVERLYQCNSCYLCTSCGYDETDPASLFIAARADIVDAGKTPACIVTHKDTLLNQTWKPQAASRKSEVGVIVDPFIANTFPDELQANLKLLEKAGVDYDIAKFEQGSGAQLFELGFWEIAKEIAEQNLQTITAAGHQTLVFLSPYDFKAFTGWYTELGLEIPDVKTMPFPACILEQVQSGKLSFSKKPGCSVTYHDANHFVRPTSNFTGIEELLKSIPDLTYKPMWNSGRKADSDAGDFLPFTYPDIAKGINEALLEEVKQTGTDVALTSCFYGLHNLRQVAQSGDPKVSDLGTFLMDCL